MINEIENFKEKLRNLIKNNGFLIGSRKWGGAKLNSDYDYVFHENKMQEVLKILDKMDVHYDVVQGYDDNGEIKHTMQNITNLKFIINNKLMNLISYDEDKFKKMKDVNACMDALKNTPAGLLIKNDKEVRVKLVEQFIIMFLKDYHEASLAVIMLHENDNKLLLE